LKPIKIALSLCVAVLVAGEARPADAPPAPDPDEVLRAALPENSMPELKQVLMKAMAEAPRIISAGLDLELAEANKKMARAPMLPTLGAGVNFGYFARQNVNTYDQKVTGSDGVEKTVPGSHTDSISKGPITTYNIGASQPLYYWGALKKQYEVSQLQRSISARNLDEARRLLALDVRRGYFNLIISANSRELELKALKQLEEELDYQKKQQADGFVTSSIVSAANTRVIDQQTQIRRSRNSYDTQWDTFLRLTTSDPSLKQNLKQEIPAINKEVGEALSRISDRVDGYRPANLNNWDDNIRAEQLNYDIYKVRLRPKLSMSLSAYQDSESPDKRTETPEVLVRDYRAMASINWTLFDGHTTEALKKSSKVRLRQYRNNLEQAEHDYRESLKAQVENLRINWDAVVRAEDSLEGARSTLQVLEKDFDTGMASKSAVDAARTALDNAYQAALNSRADYYMQISTYLSLRGKDPAGASVPNK
jgi:outer membrane protein TolC